MAMTRFMRMTKVFGFPLLIFSIALLGFIGQAQAQIMVLDFEGLGDQAMIEEFYNGGFDSQGNGPGPAFGVTFNGDALSIIDSDAGGSGNIANEPSGETVMFFLTGTAIMNVAAGFTDGFSFFYAAANVGGSVTVWDGLNASGTQIGMLNLAVNGSGCGGDPNGNFNCWDAVGVAFGGTAMSIDFGGTTNQIAFDDVTFGSDTPGAVPEPSSLLLLGLGLSAWSFARRWRGSLN